MDELQPIIDAMEAIAPEYFEVKRAGLTPKKRERVYCYELYHQMRLINDFADFTIHGEIDKRGDSSFNNSNPDFVIHHPGHKGKNDNFITIEVKVDDRQDLMLEDLKQLSYMVLDHGYQYGVFILVGRSMDWFIQHRKKAILENEYQRNANNLYIICHEKPKKVEIKSLIELRRDI